VTRRFAWAWGALAVVAAAGSAAADASLWGSTGLLSVPTAQVQPYASFAIGANWVDSDHREGAWGGGTMAQFLTVGVVPQVELSLCATNVYGRLGMQEWSRPDGGGYSIDRMVSLQWRVVDRGQELAVAVGAQDFVGTGDLGPGTSNRLYRADYVVASAGVGRLAVHAGLGSGRLRGGFGGVEWSVSPRVALVADRDAEFTNVGVRVAVARRVTADVALMGMESLGGGLTYTRAM